MQRVMRQLSVDQRAAPENAKEWKQKSIFRPFFAASPPSHPIADITNTESSDFTRLQPAIERLEWGAA